MCSSLKVLTQPSLFICSESDVTALEPAPTLSPFKEDEDSTELHDDTAREIGSSSSVIEHGDLLLATSNEMIDASADRYVHTIFLSRTLLMISTSICSVPHGHVGYSVKGSR